MQFVHQPGIDGIPQISRSQRVELLSKGLDYSKLVAGGFKHREAVVDVKDFDEFLSLVDYEKNYKSYWNQFTRTFAKDGRPTNTINKKFYEQFLSVYFSSPGPGQVAMDVAAAVGPFSHILKTKYGIVRSFHQDLVDYNTAKHAFLEDGEVERVVSNATELPVEDQSLDLMFLLNSWEHFQAPSDLDFLIEAERCLRPGGEMFIVPLKAAASAFVRTDPDLWQTKQVYDSSSDPLFRTTVPVDVDKCGQVYDQHHDADLLLEFAQKTPNLSYEVITVRLNEVPDWHPPELDRPCDVLVAERR